jgi:hypothetical protein
LPCTNIASRKIRAEALRNNQIVNNNNPTATSTSQAATGVSTNRAESAVGDVTGKIPSTFINVLSGFRIPAIVIMTGRNGRKHDYASGRSVWVVNSRRDRGEKAVSKENTE